MRRLLTILALFVATSCSAQYFTNPIVEGADPWIVKHEGRYYYCAAHNGISVSVSDVLHKTEPLKQVWHPEKGRWNSTCLWAPELHRWRNRWYIVYAAGESGPPYAYQRTGVLESVGDDAMGPYIDKGMVYTGDTLGVWSSNRWAIDMTYFEHKGQLYAVWSGWDEDVATDKTQQRLFIARMENPWTASSSRVKISDPDADYEIIGGHLPINEGPQALKHKDELFIVYSCGQSWLDTYKLSWLRLRSPDADPLRRDSWIKSPKAVFEGNEFAHGVGHASFTTSPDDKECYMVYHSKKSKKPGWERDVRIQRITFDKKGFPLFGTPVETEKPLKLPSGTKK